MIKKLFLLTIIILFSSCQKSEFENLLINSDKKWSYVNNYKWNSNLEINTYMRFYANGHYENRYFSNNKIYTFDRGGCNWKYFKNDSILELCDSKYKILKYEKDTIHLLTLKDNFKCLFINYQPKNEK